MNSNRNRKRTALPVVNTALKKALDQLVLAQNAAAISGQHAMATAIGSAVSHLRAVHTESANYSRALMH
jgi:hypothetical protein